VYFVVWKKDTTGDFLCARNYTSCFSKDFADVRYSIFFSTHIHTHTHTAGWISEQYYMYEHTHMCVITCIFFYTRVCTGSSRREKQMEIRGEKAEVFWQPRHLSRECLECLYWYSSVAGAGDFSPYSSCFWPPPVPLPFAEVSLIHGAAEEGIIPANVQISRPATRENDLYIYSPADAICHHF